MPEASAATKSEDLPGYVAPGDPGPRGRKAAPVASHEDDDDEDFDDEDFEA